MTKFYALLFFLVGFGFCAPAVNAQVTGTVVDSTGAPVPFCTVMLVKSSDSTVVTGTAANDQGIFSLEKKENGEFRILLIFSGYENLYTDVFSLSDQQPQYDAGRIMLKQKTNLMGAVEIVAAKPFMEQKLDRTVFNIENSVLASGNNALDLLRKLPGVIVDNNDNISVRGKQGVQFMIDGRKSYMSGQDMANYLRGIDASQVERIEVITNPSAKYDAAGNAIINIVMKKNKNLGFNGQLNADYQQGVYGGGSVGTNMNYKTKKWNFFGSLYAGEWQFYEEYTRTVRFNPDSSTSTSMVGNGRRHIDGNWTNQVGGIDYSPGKRHTIGVVFERSGGSRIQDRWFDANMYNANSTLDSNLYTAGPEHNRHEYYSGDLNYKFDIDSTGKQLTADFNYATFAVSSLRENATSYFGSNNQPLRLPTNDISDLYLQVHIWAGQVDYVQPMKKDVLLETGVKSSYVVTANNALYKNGINGQIVNDTNQTNEFVYTETISAAYLNLSKKVSEKLSVQLGFRGEETNSIGDQRTDSVTVKRDYFRFFPSAFVNWTIDSSNTLNISYSRRIDRPDYSDLNPFVFRTDPYTTFSGNPNLQPQMNDYYEIAHVFKGNLRTALSYMHMTSVFNVIATLDDSTHVMNSRYENLATYNVFTLEVSGTIPVKNWWTISGTGLIFHDHYFGPIGQTDFSVTYVTWLVFLQSTFSLKKDWSIEANYFYRSVNMDGVWRQDPFSSLDIGVKKKIAHGRGTIALSISDVFKTSYLNGHATYGNVDLRNEGVNDSRQVHLGISWKFGRSEYEREQRRQSAQDEKGRAQ